MKGIQNVRISNRKVSFQFELKRNITVVRGNSGTGKTTLYEMVAEYTRLGSASGVQVSCPKACVALTDTDWKYQLKKTGDSIVFIDEGAEYLSGEEFAKAIRRTDNYYVIFNRENLHALPYSVKEMYEIKTSGKYHSFARIYKEQENHLYGHMRKTAAGPEQVLLTEDTNSGFQFFSGYFEKSNVRCVAAGSNSSVFSWLQENKERKVFVIADGAAFGSEMGRVMELKKQYPDNIVLCLPESFEWMILKSGLIKEGGLEEMLANPSEFIESADYFSWERFFTDYLVQHTKNMHCAYSKLRLNAFYLVNENREKIAAVIGL